MRDPTASEPNAAPEPRPRRDAAAGEEPVATPEPMRPRESAAGEEPVRAPEEDSQTAPQPPDAEPQPARRVGDPQVNPEQPAEGSPGMLRLPVPLVAGGLIALLLVLLGVGIYANAALRGPTTVLVPTPVAQTPVGAVAAAATPSPLPATAATTPMPPAATAATGNTPRPLAAAAAVTATAPPATAVATAAPTSTELPAAPVVKATPNSTEPPSPLPTVEPTLAAEVSLAYESYWQIRADALLNLDKTHLSEAMAGDHLVSTEQLIDQLRSEGRAIQTDVDHEYQVVEAIGASAQVYDDYISRSYYVDLASHKPLTSPSTDELKVLYQMQQDGGIWKVVDSVRED